MINKRFLKKPVSRIKRRFFQKTQYVFLIISLTLSLLTHAASITTQVDRQNVILGDVIQLTYTMNDYQGQIAPDTTALYYDFDIISTGVQQRVLIHNGTAEHLNQLILVLQPKKAGSIVLPSITIGGMKTDSLTINVSRSNDNGHDGKMTETFLTAQVNTRSPYVQSEVIYTTQLYYRNQIQNGQMTEPMVEDALLVRLGDDLEYESLLHQKKYRVIERHYAIYPQRSGKVKIGSPVFTGFERQTSNSNPDFNISLGVTHRLHLQAKDTFLNVQPAPAAAKDFDWFPARDVSMTQRWKGLDSKTAGEPITRIVKIRAVGITAEQIPDIDISSSAQLSAYRDQPKNTNQYVNKNIIGEREIKIVYIPKVAGNLGIPPIALPWWDVRAGKLKVSSLPGKGLDRVSTKSNTVSAGHSSYPTLMMNTNTSTNSNKNINSNTHTNTDSKSLQQKLQLAHRSTVLLAPWQVLLLLCMVIIVISLYAVIYFKRKSIRSNSIVSNMLSNTDGTKIDIDREKFKLAINAVKQACRLEDVEELKASLFIWARYIFPDRTIMSLHQLAKLVCSDEFAVVCSDLEKVLYGGPSLSTQECEGLNFDFEKFLNVFMSIEKNRSIQGVNLFRVPRRRSKNLLPPLYY